MKPKLSIIIPAYNEENRGIQTTLKNYAEYFSKDTEIIVIPNGCKDRTPEIVAKIAEKYSNMRHKNFPEAILKGGAIIEGFKLAKGDYIGYVDADEATKAKEFERLYKEIKDSDGIIASRHMSKSQILTEQPPIRKLASFVFNIIVRTLFWFPYRDTQCGAKIFTKEAVAKIIPNMQTKDWAFDIDMLYQAKKHNLKIKEVPTIWEDQEDSTLDVKSVAPQMFLSVLKLRIKHSPFKAFLK